MAFTDPVGDMLARLKNAHLALHADVAVPHSKLKESMARILKEEGFISDYAVDDKGINVSLKYVKGQALIRGAKRISKPGRRVYVGAGEIPRVLNGLGICILSTSRGLLAGETARAENIGGELLCEVW
jgi:small subunit ribosomal protein S8